VADTKPEPDDADPRDDHTAELVAYLDGELDPKAAEALATRLTLDPKLRAEADALQRAWDILDVLPRRQPSAAFASRTLSQVIPLPPGGSGPQFVAPSGPVAATMPAIPAPRPGAGFWLGSALVILLAGLGGYFGHRAVAPPPKPAAVEVPLEDVPLMKNLRLYRNVDDVDYLRRLDSPELFGDDGE
jgi:anti-sigma factor RsiW